VNGLTLVLIGLAFFAGWKLRGNWDRARCAFDRLMGIPDDIVFTPSSNFYDHEQDDMDVIVRRFYDRELED
jgi:hypothetical protein